MRVWRVDLDDDEEELLLYTFNNDLQGILDEDGFVLLGPNSDDEATSESALFIETDRKSVLVGYKSGTDVRSFTLGGVRSGAVSSLDGKVNLQDTAELAGSSAARFRGPTAGPDLLWVSVNRSNERIDYVFDENLDENASPDPSQFGYYTRNGIKHSGDRLISIEDRVRVTSVSFCSPGSQPHQQAMSSRRAISGRPRTGSSRDSGNDATETKPATSAGERAAAAAISLIVGSRCSAVVSRSASFLIRRNCLNACPVRWSACVSAVSAWTICSRIQYAAYVPNRVPRCQSNRSAALISPRLPS